MENEKVTIERIDHGVIPSNDLGRAHRFWGTFMGGEIDHLTNLNIRDGALDSLVTDEVASLLMLPIGLAMRQVA